MRKIEKSSAFSLIELSIVILVIGILISGVFQGVKLINKFRLKTARSITTSSPVASIDGLELWLENTMENSFASYPDDQDKIALWRDINPQVATKNDAEQSNSTYQPYFVTNAINGLPGFDFASSNVRAILNGKYPINSNNSGSFSFFAILVANNNVEYQGIFDTGGFWADNGWSFNRYQSLYNSNFRYLSMNNSTEYSRSIPFSPSQGTPYVISSTLDNNNKLWFFVDGSLKNTVTSVPYSGVTTQGYKVGNAQDWIDAGGYAPWRGYIGEIIVYNRHLKNLERKSIEKYLGQKWGIEMAS